MPDGMAVSPTVNAYGQDQGPEAEEQMFKQKFSQMAYSAMSAKFADMMPYVVTFKIIEMSLEEGKAVGVFILNREGKTLYVPVVLTDSKLKPLEIMYYKDLNTFLPLNKAWIDEIGKMAIDELGQGAQLPPNVPQNVSIRDLVIPPTTSGGRIGYASAETEEDGAVRMLKEAAVQRYDVQPTQFLDVLRKSPRVALDGIKLAFEQHPRMFQAVVDNYGMDSLRSAMQEGYAQSDAAEKTASEAADRGELYVMTKEASTEDIKKVFGEGAGDAFTQMTKEGYAVKDLRKGLKNTAVSVQFPQFLEEPGGEAAWYRLYFMDGPPSEYLVIPWPQGTYCRGRKYHMSDTASERIDYLVVSKDGKEVWKTRGLVGERIFENNKGVNGSKIHKLSTGTGRGDAPNVGAYGFFLCPTEKGVEATEPFNIRTITTDRGAKKLDTDEGTFVIGNSPSRKRIDATRDFVFLPDGAKFVKIYQKDGDDTYKQRREYMRKMKSSIIKDPKMLFNWMNEMMQRSGAPRSAVKSAGLNQWWLPGQSSPAGRAEALYKVASGYSLSVQDAERVLDDASTHGSSNTYIMPFGALAPAHDALHKFAQGMEQPMAQEMPQGGPEGGMPPAGGMQPSADMMAQQQQGPSPMSPADLALGEAIQGLQQQGEQQMQQNQAQMEQLNQKMEMEMQNNQQLVGILQNIQQRTQQISQATGGQVPAGAEQSPMIAAQAIAPPPQPEPEPPPMPMMDQEGFSPEQVAEQINPEMAEQAQQFNDQGMFDTAAVSMLSSSPILQDIVSSYVPSLEKAIDNLGRILLSLWMKETETRESIGDEAYVQLEDKLRGLFRNLGEVVLSLSHNVMGAQTDDQRDQMTMQAS